jgi:NAD(P)-dependent dehydrogenase (short-subunit alcohol dehydrogenase family)
MVETQFKKMSTEKKVAFITGGNRGLGLQTARELGKLGIVVVIGSRDPEKGKTAAATLRSEGIAAESLRCDVTKPEDHRAVRNHFERRYGKLDILINNAAVMMEGENSSVAARVNRTSTVSSAILHKTFEVNFFALVALTKTLLPLVRKAPCGRIVNLSSILGSLTLQSDPGSHIYPYKAFAYDASKTALNAFTVHLAHELRDSPIKVNSAHPGWVKTDMGGSNADLEVTEGGKTSAQLATLPADGPTGGYFHLGELLPW